MAAIENQITDDVSRDNSRDRLLIWAERRAGHGTEDQLVAWHADTFRSHASFQSATDYLEPGTRALSRTSLATASGIAVATVELLRATLAFTDVFVDPSPWEEGLRRAYGAVEALGLELGS